MNLNEIYKAAPKEKKEAVCNLLKADEFELYTIQGENGNISVKGISSSSRCGVDAMSLEFVTNIKQQYGEASLLTLMVMVLNQCSDAAKHFIADRIADSINS